MFHINSSYKMIKVHLYAIFCLYIYIRTGCARKKTHFKCIYKIANDYSIFLKINLTTHNYICGQISKYEVCILNIH